VSATFFGQYLLQEGAVTSEQLLRAVQLQAGKHLRLGELAVAAGLLTLDQMGELLREQRSVDKRFGELAVAHGYLTLVQVKELLAKQRVDQQALGEVLVKMAALSEAKLKEHLSAFELAQQTAGPLGLVVKIPHGAEFSELAMLTGTLMQRCACVLSKPGVAVPGPVNFDRAFLQVQVSLVGQLRGRYILRFSKNLALQLAIGMGNRQAQTDQELVDAASEFANVVAGNFCARVASRNQSQTMAPPIATLGAEGPTVAPGAPYVMQPRFTAFGELQVLFIPS
jgi:CheY-specific phosphatase CheX